MLLAAGAVALASAPVDAVAAARCPARPVARCFTVTVALDRSGAVPGRVRLRAARVRSRRARLPPVIALTGGPGQAGVVAAETFDIILPTAGRDLVVFDQRGTGASGLLRCPAFERASATSLNPAAGSCGRSLGVSRAFYTSADSAEDLEALRVRIRAPRIALYGVSYGTRVALEYARRHPQRVERMILDSPIQPGSPDALARDTLGAVARVVNSACRDGCGGARAHPVSDIARLRARLRRAPMRVRVRGVPVRVDADDLLFVLISADVDTGLWDRIAPAVRAALGGRPAPLARLKLEAIGLGQGGLLSEFSVALFATTTCEETPLAWDPFAAPAVRRLQARAAIDATAASALYPFDRQSALRAGILPLCADWPAPARQVAAEPPLPTTIPALLLSGELDLRTPLENARVLARAIGARVVLARGVGHSVLGSDSSGCARLAVQAFLARRPAPACR